MDLGVFYICYKEQAAIEYSLRKFREFYPENPIYLVSDNGLDFSYLKEEFGNIETIKETTEVVGIARDVEQYVRDNSGNTELFLGICMEYLRRLKNGCDFCKTEYMILMEPDVLVRGKLNPFEADLVGPTANIMPRKLQEYIINNGGKNNGTWGPVGGVMKTKSFYEVYDKMMNNLDKFIGGMELDPRMVCYDYLLSYLFSLFGYTYTDNPDQTECFRNPNWKYSTHPILHQFREFYSINYEGKWKNTK